jgi:hypothetical protein
MKSLKYFIMKKENKKRIEIRGKKKERNNLTKKIKKNRN